MKAALVLAALALLFALPARADVDYSMEVTDAPGGIGDFSWTIDTPNFVQPPAPMQFDSQGNCTNCLDNFFDTFVTESAPSTGGGCQISGVWLYPDYGPAPVTKFSPLCNGLYDAYSGGALPDVGVLGTWSWTWNNYDGSVTDETLTISDPPTATPEPATWLLLCVSGIAWMGLRRFGPDRSITELS